jgi:hypothetical protein
MTKHGRDGSGTKVAIPQNAYRSRHARNYTGCRRFQPRLRNEFRKLNYQFWRGSGNSGVANSTIGPMTLPLVRSVMEAV